MVTIRQAIEKEITRGNCLTCPKKYFDKHSGFMKCDITEELIGGGKEYCKLKDLNNMPKDQTPEWEKEFDKKFPREGQEDSIYRFCRLDFPEGDSRSIKQFIRQVRQQAIEERDEKWETAIKYNVGEEQWGRIEEAFKALNK